MLTRNAKVANEKTICVRLQKRFDMSARAEDYARFREDLVKFLSETKTTFEDIKKTINQIEKQVCKLEEIYEAKIFHNSLDIFMIQRSCDQLMAVINRRIKALDMSSKKNNKAQDSSDNICKCDNPFMCF